MEIPECCCNSEAGILVDLLEFTRCAVERGGAAIDSEAISIWSSGVIPDARRQYTYPGSFLGING